MMHTVHQVLKNRVLEISDRSSLFEINTFELHDITAKMVQAASFVDFF